jgi:GNAT superfamily N-acetyltransferase
MSEGESLMYLTRRIDPSDPDCGFRCGKRPLDDYFRRHALPNDRKGIGRAYVLDAIPDDIAAGIPPISGFYTLSMASVVSADVASVIADKLPRYPMPVALIGRPAVDERARGRRLGEALLIDALQRVIAAAELIACLGVIVDAKDEDAERFYDRYDFVTLEGSAWPRRMFLPIQTAREALDESQP